MKSFIHQFWSEFMDAARVSPSLFFLPIVGAVKGIRNEYHKWFAGNLHLTPVAFHKPRHQHKGKRH